MENGVYTSTVQPLADNRYSLETELTFTEIYDDAAFVKAGISDLSDVKSRLSAIAEEETEKAAADGSRQPIIEKTENGSFKVSVRVTARATFNGTNLLPDASSRSVKSVYVGKAGCELNDFETSVSYDYSAKRPVVTIESSLSEDALSFKLKRTDKVKTYDNEMLFLLLRCFDKDALVSNSTTYVNLVEGSFSKEPTTVTVYTTQNISSLDDFKVGAVWAGDYDSSKDAADAKETFSYVSDLPYDKVENFLLCYSTTGKADEIAVIAVKDSADVTKAADSLRAHVESRRKLFLQYGPAEAARVEKAQVFTKDQYAVLIICDDSPTVKTAFDDFLPSSDTGSD